MIRAPSTAVPKLSIRSPYSLRRDSQLVSQSIAAFTITVNRPRVRTYSGSASSLTIGFTTALTIPNTRATTRKTITVVVVSPPPTTSSPLRTRVASQIATALMITRSRKFMGCIVPGEHPVGQSPRVACWPGDQPRPTPRGAVPARLCPGRTGGRHRRVQAVVQREPVPAAGRGARGGGPRGNRDQQVPGHVRRRAGRGARGAARRAPVGSGGRLWFGCGAGPSARGVLRRGRRGGARLAVLRGVPDRGEPEGCRRGHRSAGRRRPARPARDGVRRVTPDPGGPDLLAEQPDRAGGAPCGAGRLPCGRARRRRGGPGRGVHRVRPGPGRTRCTPRPGPPRRRRARPQGSRPAPHGAPPARSGCSASRSGPPGSGVTRRTPSRAGRAGRRRPAER